MNPADIKEWVGALATALPIIGTLLVFHRLRRERFDRLDAAHAKLAKRFDRIDGDFDALTRQLAGIVTDAEKRYLPRDEHSEAIGRLDSNIVELTRNISTLNGHLIDLALNRGGRMA